MEALVVTYEDLNSRETVRHRCPIDSLGRFRLELELPHTIEAFIGAREYHHILLIPNEHIALVYRGEDGLVVSGSAITEELHQQLHAYLEADLEDGSNYVYEMETMEIDSFLAALQTIRERRTAFLEAYHEEHELHPFLYQWAQNDIYFKYL